MAAGILDSTKLSGVLSAADLGGDAFFDEIERESVVFSLGKNIGALPRGTNTIAVPDTLISAAFVSATGEKPVSDGGLATKNLNAGKIAAIVLIPQEVIDDSSIDLFNDWIKPQIPKAFGAALDRAALFGEGLPVEWTDIQSGLVPQATTAGNVVTASDDAYADIMGESGLMAKVEEDGFEVTGFAGSPKSKAYLRGARDKDGRPLYQTYADPLTKKAEKTLDGEPYMVLNNGAWNDSKARLVGGDFSKLVYGIRKDIEYKISTEATVKFGSTTVNCFQQNVVAFLMEMRVAAGIINPANGVNDDNSTRFPFAVIKPGA